MMLYKTRGIVLKNIKYSESSNIIKIYTEAFGLRSYMVRGLRKPKSKTKTSLFQHLSLLDMIVYENPKKDIQNIKEVKPAFIFRDIPYSIAKSSLVLFMNELILKSIREEEANPALFRFLYDSLQLLDEASGGIANFHLLFSMHFTRYLGFFPAKPGLANAFHFDLREGIFTSGNPAQGEYLSEEQTKLLKQILDLQLENSHQLQVNKSQRKEMLGIILKYYRIHLPDFSLMKSVEVLESVYN